MRIEQSVIRGAAQIQFAAGREHHLQMFAIDVTQEAHALFENLADGVVEILRGLPVDPDNQNGAPDQKEQAVDVR